MVLVLGRRNTNQDINQNTYTPLSQEDGSFRLLEILPPSSLPPVSTTTTTNITSPAPTSTTSFDSVIECRLHSAHIERAAGTYDALSYQWGRQPQPGQPGYGHGHGHGHGHSSRSRSMVMISLDGQEFRIQHNLWLFLKQLRKYYDYSHGRRYLWVDAISINQNDLAERGQQVQLMNRIFPSAARVLVWLGEEADGSDRALTFLQYVYERFRLEAGDGSNSDSDDNDHARARAKARAGDKAKSEARAKAGSRAKARAIAKAREVNNMPTTSTTSSTTSSTTVASATAAKVYKTLFGDNDEVHVWKALLRLCERDYWTRLWIIQEVLLAQELVLFCGNRSVSWDAFKYACAGPATVKGFPGTIQPSHSSSSHADSVFGPVHNAKMAMSSSQFRELSHQRALQRPRYLYQLIEAYGDAQCTDIRDRIYGLLGLARDWTGSGSDIEIDYSRSELALLIDALCLSHIKDEDASRFGLLLIHVLQLDKPTTTPTAASYGGSHGFSSVFANALRDMAGAAVATPVVVVGSNAPWLESPSSINPTTDTTNTRSLSSNSLSMACHTFHTINIALRRQITLIYPSSLGTSRFTTNSTSSSAYTHFSIQVGDLVFSMPHTAIGLIYRPYSSKTLQYIGWAIPEAALNRLDPFWITDAGVDASLRFLSTSNSNSNSSRGLLQVNAISDVLHLTVKVSVWDLLFLLSCSPNGYSRTDAFWWGKPLPINDTRSCYQISFGDPDPRFIKRSRTWRY